MQFSSIVALLSVAAVAVASPIASWSGGSEGGAEGGAAGSAPGSSSTTIGNACGVGEQASCCNGSSTAELLGLIPIGDCTLAGLLGSACSQPNACCSQVEQVGLINLACTNLVL